VPSAGASRRRSLGRPDDCYARGALARTCRRRQLPRRRCARELRDRSESESDRQTCVSRGVAGVRRTLALMVVTKRRASAFAGSDLDMVLRAAGIEVLVLSGIATSDVVLSTVRQAADLDFCSPCSWTPASTAMSPPCAVRERTLTRFPDPLTVRCSSAANRHALSQGSRYSLNASRSRWSCQRTRPRRARTYPS
jgi:hypothetical protein